MKSNALSAELRQKIDAYWRAANYLSVGQIFLYDNPLLKRPLALTDVKRMLLGHWGTGALGHDAGAELHPCAPEPGDQAIRSGHDLRVRPRTRWPGGGGQYLS